ncbi:WXG100 family type VII secretion target [Lentzea sp. NPDC059081]|uniref:WXG100 family type VII secretion target n=1 Tax=Lentzea sp. NPDC059081 TaxID=3346719 RepID=UPI0036AAD7D0
MGGQIKATFGEISNAASTIASSSKAIDDINDQLRQKVTSTLAGWEGSAGEAYQGAQKAWDSASDDLNQVLAAIGVAVQQASEAYAQAEQTNASRW